MIKSVYGIKRTGSIRDERNDNSPVKRVELHCHTQMSDMDAVSSATSIVRQAYHFGMKALAMRPIRRSAGRRVSRRTRT